MTEGYFTYCTGGSTGQDILLIKTDANGQYQFARSYDLSFSSNSLLDDGFQVLSTQDGGILIAGETKLNAGAAPFLFMVKLSQNLFTEWYKPTLSNKTIVSSRFCKVRIKDICFQGAV